MKLKKNDINSQSFQGNVVNSDLNSHTLSIEECKRYLGNTKLSDKEIKELRDAICSFIDNILDNYFDELVQ